MAHAQPQERGPDPLEDHFFGVFLEGRPVRRPPGVAGLTDQPGSHIGQVVARVAFFRQRSVLAERLQVARLQGAPQHLHLPPGVVEVILALNLVADGFQHAGDGIADHRAACAPDVQRPGRVGADELHLGAPARADVQPAEVIALGDDRLHLLLEPVVAQAKVDETRPRDLGRANERGVREMAEDDRRDLCRRFAGQTAELHRHRRGIVGIARIVRWLHPHFRNLKRRQIARRLSAPNRFPDQPGMFVHQNLQRRKLLVRNASPRLTRAILA